MKYLVMALISVSLLACTKKNGTEKSKLTKITFDSPFQFVYDPTLTKTDVVASFLDEKIEKNQLSQNRRAISDLIERKNEKIVALGYQVALFEAKKKDSETVFKLPFEEPKEGIKKILESNGIKLNEEKINVQFAADDVESQSIKVNEKSYSESDLAKGSLPFSKMLREIFILKMNAVEDQVSRRVLLNEAKKNNVSLAQYINEKIKKDNSVSEAEAKQYGIDNNIPESEIDEEMLQRLKSIIETKRSTDDIVNHSAKVLSGKPVKVAFNKPLFVVDDISLPERTPQKGSGEIKVTLLSSLMCNECQDIEKELSRLVEKSKEDLKLSYIFHFKPEDRINRMVSEASLCVAKQDESKFWEFQQASHSDHFDGSEGTINEIVKSLSIDYDEFRSCFLSREFKQTIDNQKMAVQSMGYLKLPVVIVNGLVFENPQSIDEVKEAIETQMTLAGKSKPTGFWAWIKSFFS